MSRSILCIDTYPPDRHGASAMHNPTYENQEAPQEIQDKKNGTDTPFLGLPVSSISAAVSWPPWLEKPVFLQKKPSLLTGDTWEALQCIRLHRKYLEGACRSFKVLTLAHPKIFELVILYVGVYCGI